MNMNGVRRNGGKGYFLVVYSAMASRSSAQCMPNASELLTSNDPPVTGSKVTGSVQSVCGLKVEVG